MDVPILQTKLYIPQVNPMELIARPRLTQRLDEALTRKLTLISAPAGSGKTTLVSQWLCLTAGEQRGRPRPEASPELVEGPVEGGAEENFTPVPPYPRSSAQFAWLSLDEGDNDPVRFWTYLIAALESIQAGLGANVLPLLNAPQPSPVEILLTLLLNDLASLSTEVALVLDDYNLIENPDIHSALTLLLDRLPPQMHLILTSRIDPPLPLARWRMKRQLTELRAEALRFTPDETDLLFNHLSGLNLTKEQITALEAKTEGWVAGLQLAALSLQGRADIENFISGFTGTHRYVLDYMTEEILSRQPDHVQSFLLQTAILERLTGPLCDALTGRADGQALLEQLARANLFIISLDDQGHWYRYQHLFADLLRHHLHQNASPFAGLLAQELPGGVRELHRRAAAWYEAEGLAEEAIHHALAAQEFEWAGRLMLNYCKIVFARGEVTLVLRWFRALPETWLRSRPRLNVLYAWLLFFTGHFEAVQRKLEEIESAGLHNESSIEPAGAEGIFNYHELPGLIAGLQAQMAVFKGNLPRAIELSQQALAQLPQDEPGARGLISQNLAGVYWLNGEPEKANRLLTELSETAPNGHELSALMPLSHMAELKRMQGQYRQAAALYRRILQLATEQKKPGLWLITGPVHAELGFLLYEWNELAAAEEHLRQGIKLGHQGAGWRALLMGYHGLFRILLAQEKFAEAFELIQQMEQLTQNLDSGLLLDLTALMRLNLWLRQGDLEAVAQWRQASGLQVDDEWSGIQAFLTYMGLARALMAENELEAAMALLAQLLSFMEGAQQTNGIIQVLVLQAITWQAQNKPEQALAALQRALALAEPEGYIRIFVDEGAPLAALLLKLLATLPQNSWPAPTYLSNLLAALGIEGSALLKPGPTPAKPQPFVEPLTERELEVLALMATGLTNQEIALQLIIGKNTLKTHIRNIYSKLEVNNRIQAIAKGEALKLL